jgi:uncharacterized protein (DUF1684 family)
MSRTFKSISAFMLLAFAVLALGAVSPKEPDAAYVQSFEKWKAEQTADLKENWLPLAGLFWLKPGTNSFGSDASNKVVFPKGLAHAGEFDLHGTNVTLKLLPDVHATIDGNAVTSAKLEPDTSIHPSNVEMGTLRFHVIVRGERVGIRLRDNDSDRARNFKGMVFYPLDTSYRVTATWTPSDGKKKLEVPNVLGDVSALTTPGAATFTVNGAAIKLTALSGDEKKGLFFVFNDPTLKKDTYPGGRFLDTGPVVDGHVILDFNRAYNPPCAVTPYATCPLAPKENRLTVEIPAGEKFDRAAHDHR